MAKKDFITDDDIKYRLSQLDPELNFPTDKACLVLGVEKNTLEHWRVKGYPPPFRALGYGSRPSIVYKLRELLAYIEDRKVTKTAEAREASKLAMARMVDFDPWDRRKHPFWYRGGFVVDSVFGSKDFVELLTDPSTQVKWMTISKGLSQPWTNDELRRGYFGQLMNKPGLNKTKLRKWRAVVEVGFEQSLAKLDPAKWHSAPNLTQDKFKVRGMVGIGPDGVQLI